MACQYSFASIGDFKPADAWPNILTDQDKDCVCVCVCVCLSVCLSVCQTLHCVQVAPCNRFKKSNKTVSKKATANKRKKKKKNIRREKNEVAPPSKKF